MTAAEIDRFDLITILDERTRDVPSGDLTDALRSILAEIDHNVVLSYATVVADSEIRRRRQIEEIRDPCPRCGVPAGSWCVGPAGKRLATHLARRRLVVPEDHVTLQDAAEILGVSRSRMGQLKERLGAVLIDRHWYVTQAALDEHAAWRAEKRWRTTERKLSEFTLAAVVDTFGWSSFTVDDVAAEVRNIGKKLAPMAISTLASRGAIVEIRDGVWAVKPGNAQVTSH